MAEALSSSARARSLQLTLAGAQLLEESRSANKTLNSALRRVQEVHRGVERLVVAFSPGLHVSEPMRAFTAAHSEVELELFKPQWWEQNKPLRDGRADVAYLRRPFDDDSLRSISVGSEAMVACVPSNHRLARRLG